MTKNLTIYGGITLAIVLGLFGLFHVNTITQQGPTGSVVSLEQVDSPYYNIGGIKSYNIRQPFAATSTQLCTIVNPFKATSTLVRFSATITTGIIGTNTFTLSTTTTASAGNFGSSSPALILDHSVVASAVDSVFWTPSSATTTNRVLSGISSATGESYATLAPLEVLTYRFATSTGASTLGTFLAGYCTAVIQQI